MSKTTKMYCFFIGFTVINQHIVLHICEVGW